MPNISVLENNQSEQITCALCQRPDTAYMPTWLYVDADKTKPVCLACAHAQEPELADAVVKRNNRQIKGMMRTPDDPIKDGFERGLRKYLMYADDDRLRLRTHSVEFTNQDIVEYAYLVKESLEAGGHGMFERENCLEACKHNAKLLLNVVDVDYLKKHKELCRFYKILIEDNLDFLTINGSRYPFPDHSEVNIIVKENRTIMECSCCICGTTHTLKSPLWHFNRGNTVNSVCPQCAERYEPKMFKGVKAINDAYEASIPF